MGCAYIVDAMPILKSSRRERFAQFLADGVLQGKAYRDAGFAADKKHHASAACRLAKETEIQARVEEIKAERARMAAERNLVNLEMATKFFLNLAATSAKIGKEKQDASHINAARGAMAEACKLNGIYPEKIPSNSIVINPDGEKRAGGQTKAPAESPASPQVVINISGNDAKL